MTHENQFGVFPDHTHKSPRIVFPRHFDLGSLHVSLPGINQILSFGTSCKPILPNGKFGKSLRAFFWGVDMLVPRRVGAYPHALSVVFFSQLPSSIPCASGKKEEVSSGRKSWAFQPLETPCFTPTKGMAESNGHKNSI